MIANRWIERVGIMMLIAISSATVSLAQGGLIFEKNTVFAKHKAGEKTVTADFNFTNMGGRMINIADIMSSCGCTTATPSGRQFAPRASGSIAVVFTVGDREGHQSKAIVVRTDETSGNEYVLKFETDIPKILSVSPKYIYWQHDSSADPRLLSVDVVPPEKLKEIKVDDTSGAFVVEIKNLDGGKGCYLSVTPRSTAHPVQRQLAMHFQTVSGIMFNRTVVLRVLPEAKDFDRHVVAPPSQKVAK